MNERQYIIINRIEKETEKAILVDANGQRWLPKSQIKVHTIENAPMVIEMPTWLWQKNRTAFTIRTDPKTVYEATGYMI